MTHQEIIVDAEATLDVANVPVDLAISNTTDHAVNLPIYPDNGTYELLPNKGLIYKVQNSREYLYYVKTCQALGLEYSETAVAVDDTRV